MMGNLCAITAVGSKPLIPGRAMVTRQFEYEAVKSRIEQSAAEIESGRRRFRLDFGVLTVNNVNAYRRV